MKNFNHIILAVLFTLFAFSVVEAQEQMPPNDDAPQNLKQPVRRPNLLAELNLSQNQVRQIRRINADNKLLRRDAQQKLRDAQRNLDQAVYADNADEAEIQTLINETHSAQMEVLRLRIMTEVAVRKVLTPEQLVKFREIRLQFTDRTERLPRQQNVRPSNAPNQRIINRQRRLRNNN